MQIPAGFDLPEGLVFDSSAGTVSGTAPGIYSVSFECFTDTFPASSVTEEQRGSFTLLATEFLP